MQTMEIVRAEQLPDVTIDQLWEDFYAGSTPVVDAETMWLQDQAIQGVGPVAAEAVTYINLDDVAEVAARRQEIREQAWATLERRRQRINQHQGEYLPLPIDALSTAQKALAAGRQYGEGSEQHKELLTGLWLDCSRLLKEWHHKNKPEHFEAVHHSFDPDTEDFYSHGLPTGQMTENALTPTAGDPEQDNRRVNERVEEATPLILKDVGGVALSRSGVRIRTISQCTEKAIRDYRRDQASGAPHRGYDGLVPEIAKVMIRDIRLDNITGGRWEEQIGLPGIYLTHEIFLEAIRRRGVDVAATEGVVLHGTQLPVEDRLAREKTALHGAQLLVEDDLVEDFVPLLDTVASEEWCTNVFLGEEVPADHPKDYGRVRAEARQRQIDLEPHSQLVAQFVLDLAENNTDAREAPTLVEEFVKKLLMNMARHDNSLAEQMFDEKTAQGLRQVADLERVGRDQEAFELFRRVEEAAPGGGYCGAGSCGLEAIHAGSADEKAAEKLGFGDSRDVIKDTERKCARCKSKTVYYDLRLAKKGCTSCGETAKY